MIFLDDLHQQRLARLAWELETRKKLDAEAQVGIYIPTMQKANTEM